MTDERKKLGKLSLEKAHEWQHTAATIAGLVRQREGIDILIGAVVHQRQHLLDSTRLKPGAVVEVDEDGNIWEAAAVEATPHVHDGSEPHAH